MTAPAAFRAAPRVLALPVGALRAFEFWLTSYRRTWRGSVVSSVVEPVLFLTSMGVGLGGYVHGGTGRLDGVRYAVYLAPGLLAAAAMQTAMGEATWPVLGAIKWQKAYIAMIASPLTVAEVMLGHLLFMAMRLVLVATAFTAVAAAFGLLPSAGGAVLALLCAVLTGLAFAAPIAAFSIGRERETGFSILYRFGLIPLFLFSGTFFPVAQLPGGIRWLAYASPLWHGVDLCRSLALGRGTAAGMLLHAVVLLACLSAGVVLAARGYRKRLAP